MGDTVAERLWVRGGGYDDGWWVEDAHSLLARVLGGQEGNIWRERHIKKRKGQMTPHSRPWIDQSIRTLRREVRGEKMGGGGFLHCIGRRLWPDR